MPYGGRRPACAVPRASGPGPGHWDSDADSDADGEEDPPAAGDSLAPETSVFGFVDAGALCEADGLCDALGTSVGPQPEK